MRSARGRDALILAVLAAYAALLQRLDACGCGRREAETPEEHLRRALDTVAVPPRPLREIVALYVEARYSTHSITEAMRDRARRAFAAAASLRPVPRWFSRFASRMRFGVSRPSST